MKLTKKINIANNRAGKGHRVHSKCYDTRDTQTDLQNAQTIQKCFNAIK